MKKIITVLILAALCTAAFAQKITYKELKGTYSYKDYVKSDTDPYQVFWIGLESFAVPGMGQLVMRETGRGWAFLGAHAVLGSVADECINSARKLIATNAEGKYYVPDEDQDKFMGLVAGLAAAGLADLGVAIWSSVDAVRIAKVKNMYYQDNAKHASATLYPSFNLVESGTGMVPVTGMTFALTF